MTKIKVVKPFSYAYEGIQIVHYAPGIHEVSKRCAEVALAEGWAKRTAKRTEKRIGKKS